MNKVVRILFLAANPKDTNRLRLDEEMREIDQALRRSEFRDKFDIQQHWAVRIADLQQFLLRHRPNIVHFSGHGSEANEILMEDSSGKSRPVSSRALGRLFSVLQDDIHCVILNACYSEQQSKAIAKYIDCVIGMSKAIGDLAAISFAAAFYQALGFGKDIKTAFDLGCVQIDLEGLNEQDTPKLIAIKSNPTEIVLTKTEASPTVESQSPIAVIHILEEFVEQPHWSPFAPIRFSITNLSHRVIKLTRLLIKITKRQRIAKIALKKAGAPLIEFRLTAEIGNIDELDLLQTVEEQFVLNLGNSDAFNLALAGPEGYLFTCYLSGRVDDLITRQYEWINSPLFQVQYPVRSLAGLGKQTNSS